MSVMKPAPHFHDQLTGQVRPKPPQTTLSGYVRGETHIRRLGKRVAEATAPSYQLHTGTVNNYRRINRPPAGRSNGKYRLMHYRLAFGGDDFTYSMFDLKSKEFSVTYKSEIKYQDGGQGRVYTIYEFSQSGTNITFKDGRPLEGDIYLTLSNPPGVMDGDAGVVFIFDNSGKKVIPVGRAVLWFQERPRLST